MGDIEESIVADTPSLKDFKLKEILSNDAGRKKIVLLGNFSESEDKMMILFVEKVEFAEENFKTEKDDEAILKHILTTQLMVNDIYADFTATIDPRLNSKLKILSLFRL